MSVTQRQVSLRHRSCVRVLFMRGTWWAVWTCYPTCRNGLEFYFIYFKVTTKESVRCNGRENITHVLNPTTTTQDRNRSISFIFARNHICFAAYPPSHPRRWWPRSSHKKNKKCVLNMVNSKASLSPSLLPLTLSLPLSLSRSLSLTLAMSKLLFSLATFFRGMHV